MKLSEIKKNLAMMRYAFGAYESVSFYGAGAFADILLQWLANFRKTPDGVIVSRGTDKTIRGVPVSEFDPTRQYSGMLIIAVSAKYHSEIIEQVQDHFEGIILFPDEFFRCLEMLNHLEIRNADNSWSKCIGSGCNIDCLESEKTIWLQCSGGIGDSLILEPVCRKLKKYGYRIVLLSWHSDVFRKCESIDYLSIPTCSINLQGSIFISVDGIYESHPFQHILDSYIGIVRQFVHGFDITSEDRIPIYDKSLIREHNPSVKRICVNVEASGWESRLYETAKMKAVLINLKDKGYELMEVGSRRENYLGVGEDCFGFSLHDTLELMSNTDLYFGVDNGLMHLAQAIRLPVFILFGCVCPLYRIHDWSRARVMWKNVDELPCAGCYHRRQIPCRKPECINDEYYCMDWTPEEVVRNFENLKYDNPPELKKEMLVPLWG